MDDWRCCKSKHWPKVIAIFGFALVLLGIILVIVFAANAGENTDRKRYCFEMRGLNPGGDVDGIMLGEVSLYFNNPQITWNFTHVNLDTITAVHIAGPLQPPADMEIADLSIALCGLPSALVCDNSVPNRMMGELIEISPGGYSPKLYVREINENPSLFYLEIRTISYPDGALRASLINRC